MGKIIDFYDKKKQQEIYEKERQNIIDKVSKYYKTKNKDDYRNAALLCSMKLVFYSLNKDKFENQELKNDLQMGFIIFLNEFSTEYEVKDFVADLLLDMIFKSEKDTLECKLHHYYHSREEIIKKGFNNVLIDIISSHDSNLANYIRENIKLINRFHDIIKNYLINWDTFDDNMAYVDYKKYYEIYTLIENFILNHNEFLNEEVMLLAYIEEEFDIHLIYYFKIVNKNDILNTIPKEVYLERIKNLPLDKQKKLLELKRVIKRYLKGDNKKLSYEELKKKK